MKTASINYEKLDQLVKHIRNNKRLSNNVRRELATEILKQADAIAQTDIENLMCIPCAARLSGYTLAGFRRLAAREFTIYRLCHRERLNHFHGMRNKSAMIEYVDRKDVLRAKERKERWRAIYSPTPQ